MRAPALDEGEVLELRCRVDEIDAPFPSLTVEQRAEFGRLPSPGSGPGTCVPAGPSVAAA